MPMMRSAHRLGLGAMLMALASTLPAGRRAKSPAGGGAGQQAQVNAERAAQAADRAAWQPNRRKSRPIARKAVEDATRRSTG